MKKTNVQQLIAILIIGLLMLGGMGACHKDDNVDPQKQDNNDSFQTGISSLEIQNDYKEALKIFRSAADNGDDSAMVAAALIYEYGLVSETNIDSALWFYNQAAKVGNETAKLKIKNLTNKDKNLNTVTFPKDFQHTYNQVFISTSDGIQTVNGNATFEGTGSFKALLGDGKPLYFSFNNKGHKSTINLDAKETAASLLILAMPYVLSSPADDQDFDSFKNAIKSLPLTEKFAEEIDKCIINKGFLDPEELSRIIEPFAEEFGQYLFEKGDNKSKSYRIPTIIQQSGGSKLVVKKDEINRFVSNGLSPILVVSKNDEMNGYSFTIQSEEVTLTNAIYNEINDSWKCHFKIVNGNPHYISISKIKFSKITNFTANDLLNGLNTWEKLETVIGPSLPPNVLSLDGWSTIIKNTFMGIKDLITEGALNDYLSESKDITVELSSADDALAVTSFNFNYPDLIGYYIANDILLPAFCEYIDEQLELKNEFIIRFATRLITDLEIQEILRKISNIIDNSAKYTAIDIIDQLDSLCKELFEQSLSVFEDFMSEQFFGTDLYKDKDLTDKGYKLMKNTFDKFGANTTKYFFKIEQSLADIGTTLSGWTKFYNGAYKMFKWFIPWTGIKFQPFTFSLSPKSFAQNNSNDSPIQDPGSNNPPSEIEVPTIHFHRSDKSYQPAGGTTDYAAHDSEGYFWATANPSSSSISISVNGNPTSNKIYFKDLQVGENNIIVKANNQGIERSATLTLIISETETLTTPQITSVKVNGSPMSNGSPKDFDYNDEVQIEVTTDIDCDDISVDFPGYDDTKHGNNTEFDATKSGKVTITATKNGKSSSFEFYIEVEENTPSSAPKITSVIVNKSQITNGGKKYLDWGDKVNIEVNTDIECDEISIDYPNYERDKKVEYNTKSYNTSFDAKKYGTATIVATKNGKTDKFEFKILVYETEDASVLPNNGAQIEAHNYWICNDLVLQAAEKANFTGSYMVCTNGEDEYNILTVHKESGVFSTEQIRLIVSTSITDLSDKNVIAQEPVQGRERDYSIKITPTNKELYLIVYVGGGDCGSVAIDGYYCGPFYYHNAIK